MQLVKLFMNAPVAGGSQSRGREYVYRIVEVLDSLQSGTACSDTAFA